MSTRAAEQVATSPYAPPASSNASSRLQSIDLVRGVIMVLMAIDHVRVYSGVPAGGQTPGVFFTRWVTHFCAPLFVFLAGTSAFYNGRKLGDMGRLSRFLVTRGAMLVVMELTLIKFSWTFALDYQSFTLAGVIWMLGWCMMILGALVKLSPQVVGWLGVAIVVLQQVFGFAGRGMPAPIRSFWEFIYTTGAEAPAGISVLYVIVPWIGVMAAGYGFGLLLDRPREERDRILVRLGLALTAFFLIVGAVTALRATGENLPPFYVRLLNQQKYPASQLFLCMTLGPAIALMPLAERARGAVARAAITIGRVPLFYYLAHIPLIHLSALAVNAMVNGGAHQDSYGSAPFTQVPEASRWSLGLLYLVFAIDVALLYGACRWYARRKANQPAPWMKYI